MRSVHAGLCSLLGCSAALVCGCMEWPGQATDTAAREHAVASAAADPALPELPPVPADPDANCKKAAPKDVLISELVLDSWRVGYPLTALRVDAAGTVTGDALPPELQAQLELINTVPEARDSVARALRKVSGLPPYGMAGIGAGEAACDSVMAWTPSGPALISTGAFWVQTDGVNEESWRTTHREFGKECPLVKTVGNRDVIDPPGDGSTNEPPSTTVSAYGVRANSYGLCPSWSSPSTYCKLSYATGVNWTGRFCTQYYGYNRCLVR